MKNKKQAEELPFDIVQGYDTHEIGPRISMGGLTLTEIRQVPHIFPDYFTTNHYIIQFMTQGEMHAKINLQDIHIKAPCAFVLLPEFVLHFDDSTPDTNLLTISFTGDFAEKLHLPVLPYHIINAIHRTPIFQFTEEQMQSVERFYDLLKEIVEHHDNSPYAHDAAVALLRSLIRHTQGFFHERFEQQPSLSRAEELTNDFVAMAKKDCVQERSVDYYAERLHVSPKYLANVVKERTGRTVGDWLAGFTLFRAKVMLKTSRRNIQQIAEALGFANQSHFGTWFRRQTGGVSPKEFRKTKQQLPTANA